VSWCVTSPWGPLQSSSWSCCQCPCSALPGVLSAEQARAGASEHVRSAGHQVSVYRGTSELLLPLNTAAPRKELTP
jgi:hypothetical protein